MALPTFDEFRDKLCNELGCSYEERQVETPPNSKKYVTAGVFKHGSKIATFVRSNIGKHVDADSVCSICGRLGGIDPSAVFGVTCPKR